MHEFDAYINEIIESLKIDKKQKIEMSEEFNDHLYMLKKEYIESGMTEENAVKKAIEVFGNSIDLKKCLSQSTTNYKTIYNILFGILLFIPIFRLAAFIPVPAYNPTREIILLQILPSILLFSILGYFLPILFHKFNNIKHIALISIPFSLALGIFIGIIHNSLLLSLIAFCILGGIIGSLIGFMILLSFNKIVSRLKYS